jgi:hypothetical protein
MEKPCSTIFVAQKEVRLAAMNMGYLSSAKQRKYSQNQNPYTATHCGDQAKMTHGESYWIAHVAARVSTRVLQ